jgi:FkbM family methyltransferase
MGSFVDRYLYLLVHLKGLLLGSFSRPYYSQWGEDIVLSGLFSGQKRGFYIDVGAFHPFHYSNTALLYKKGWRGINIDPNPASIALFRIHRGGDVNLNYGVSEHAEEKPYYIFNHQSCNTFSEAQKEVMLKKSFIRLIGTKPIPCTPLQALVDEHARGKQIDFLNVDVEGMSMEVLRSLDFSKNAPKVICVEDDEFDVRKPSFGSEIFTYLGARGYALHSKVGRSTIYTLQ